MNNVIGLRLLLILFFINLSFAQDQETKSYKGVLENNNDAVLNEILGSVSPLKIPIESANNLFGDHSESGEPDNKLFEFYYYPESTNEVALERSNYLKNGGSYRNLVPHYDTKGLQKTNINEWESVGPYGITTCPDPVRNDKIYSGCIISLGQDYNDGNIMYLGAASGGLWKSKDRGETWENILDTLPNPSVSTIATNISKTGEVWIGTGNKGDVNGNLPSLGLVFYSSDYGGTWHQINFTSRFIGFVSKIVIRPAARIDLPDVVFIATNNGIFRSEDKVYWTKVLDGSFSDLVYVGSILDTNFYMVAAERNDVNNSPIWFSNNNGITDSWSSRTLPVANDSLGRITLTSSRLGFNTIVYANAASKNDDIEGIWRSKNSGDTWEKVNSPYTGSHQMNYNNTILMDDDVISGNTVYTGANLRGLYYSTDAGETWNSSGENPLGIIHEDEHVIHDDVSQSGKIFVGNDGGLYTSKDRGKNFEYIGNQFLSISQIYHLTVSPENGGLYEGRRFYVGTQDNGIQRGPDEFLRWTSITCCDGGDIAFKDGIQYSTIVGLSDSSDHRVQHPPDKNPCESWDGFTNGLPKGQPSGSQLIYNGNNFYLSFAGSVYKAADGELPWVMLQNFGCCITRMGVTPENIVVIGTIDPIPVRISNYDNTTFNDPANPAAFWQNKNVTDIDFGFPIGTAEIKRDIYVTLSGLYGIRVAEKKYNADSFINITGDLPNLVNVRSLLVDPHNDNVIYIGSDFGVYVSFNLRGEEDENRHWINISEKLPSVCYVTDLEYDDYSNKIVAATYGRGVFIADRATIPTDVEIADNKILKFKLYDNYPNPFNPVTNIKYDLPYGVNVKLTVYNSIGQLIKILQNGYNEGGKHSLEFDARNLPSGIYFYEIQAENFSAVKKLVLIK